MQESSGGGGIEDGAQASHVVRRWQLVTRVQEPQSSAGWIPGIVGGALRWRVGDRRRCTACPTRFEGRAASL
jgi:hypothetical protein